MQKHTKQLIAAVALLLVAAVPLALHIANADSTDETVARAAASSSEAQAAVPVTSSTASAAAAPSEAEPRSFFDVRSAFGGFIPCGGVVSCGVLFVFDIGVGLVWQLAYNGDYGRKGQCVCAAAPEPAKTQQQKTVSDRKQCVQ